MTTKNRKIIFLVTGIVFLFYLYIAMNMAFTQDDWTWGSSVGWGRFQHWFQGYNGRYLGDLTEVLITRSFTARVVFMSVFCTGVIYLLWRLIGIKHVHNGIVVFFLVLSLPTDIFAETYGWGAGFSNYIMGAFFSLLYLNIIKTIIEPGPTVYPRGAWLAMIPLGIASELFIEHVTLYNFVVAAAVMVYTYIRNRKIHLLHATYFLSVLAGMAIMFSNPAYMKMLHGTYGVGRSVAFMEHKTSLFMKIMNAAGEIYPFYIFDNTVLIIAMSFLGILLLYSTKSLRKVYSWILTGILVSFVIYKILWMGTDHVRFNGLRPLEGFYSLVYLIAVFMVIGLTIKDKMSRFRSLFYLLSSGVLAAPFLIISPHSPREFLSSYLMLALLVAELVNVVIKPSMWKLVWRCSSIGAVSMMMMYFGVFTRIGQTTHLRNHEIHHQLAEQAKVMKITKYRYTQFMKESAPNKGTWTYKTFTLYYHIPKNVKVQFVRSK